MNTKRAGLVVGLWLVVWAGCGGATQPAGLEPSAGPPAADVEAAFHTCWEAIGGMERESRPTIRWTVPDCGAALGELCNGAWVDGNGNATVPWTGKISHEPGFPTVLARYRNWLRYSSFKTHTDEQAAFEQSFVEGLTSIGL